MHFKGNVGEYAVTLKIKPTGTGYRSMAMGRYVNDYIGSYTYTKAGNTLRLKGHDGMSANELHLEEITPKGKISANWYLTFDDDWKILTGHMTLTSNGKEIPVRLWLKP